MEWWELFSVVVVYCCLVGSIGMLFVELIAGFCGGLQSFTCLWWCCDWLRHVAADLLCVVSGCAVVMVNWFLLVCLFLFCSGVIFLVSLCCVWGFGVCMWVVLWWWLGFWLPIGRGRVFVVVLGWFYFDSHVGGSVWVGVFV